MFEVTVKIRNSETSLSKKFICYDERVEISTESTTLSQMVEETKEGFVGDIEDINLTIKMVWR